MRNIDKFLHITMPDGSVYSVPVDYLRQCLTRRLLSYQNIHNTEENLIIARERVFCMVENEFEFFLDRCIGNLDWEDVAPMAKLVSTSPKDFQEGWLNGDKKLV